MNLHFPILLNVSLALYLGLSVKTLKMEGKATVDGLKNHFETIIRRTFLAYDLRNCNDPVDKETLRAIEQDVRYMERAVTELKKVSILWHKWLMCRIATDLMQSFLMEI